MSSEDTELSMQGDESVELIVGGLRYTISATHLLKHPDSFFGALLKKEWRSDKTAPITIDRDGCIFQYVFMFLVAGVLPRHQDRTIALEETTLNALTVEADFYNLSALMKECEANPAPAQVLANLGAYSTIRNHISKVKSVLNGYGYSKPRVPLLSCEYSSTKSNALVNVLASVWAPFCAKGRIYSHNGQNKLYKTSTFDKPNIEELLAEAQQSAFGKGLETVTDTTVRNSLEIDASKMDMGNLKSLAQQVHLASFAPKRKVELRPYKLVIYQEGGHFEQHRDTVRGDNHIGTLVLILNSKYTGGELEISHGGKTEVVTGPYSWVAMYGDCLHKINPVTSGTRVSLIYDIYAEDFDQAEDAEGGGSDEDEDEEEDEDNDEAEKLGNLHECTHSSSDLRYMLGVSPQLEPRVLAALDRELSNFDTVIICLAHLYPYCQANPSFLKGGDLALFELLRDKYEVTVEAVSMFMTRDEEERTGELMAAMLRDVEGGAAGADGDGAPVAKKSKTSSPTLFVIPTNLDADSVLDYSPYIEHTGNESQQEETVYIVSGLQVRRK